MHVIKNRSLVNEGLTMAGHQQMQLLYICVHMNHLTLLSPMVDCTFYTVEGMMWWDSHYRETIMLTIRPLA